MNIKGLELTMRKIIDKINKGQKFVDLSVGCEKEKVTEFEKLRVKRANLIKVFCLNCIKTKCNGNCNEVKEYEKWVKSNITL